MNTYLDFKVNISDLMVTIHLNDENLKIINEIQLLFSASTEFSEKKSSFELPWFELRRQLTALTYIIKREGVIVQFDEELKKLITATVADKKSLKTRTNSEKPSTNFVYETLNKIKFNRILKDEQLRDVSNMLFLKHGANFSVPGAGKTTTVLALHSILRYQGIVSKLFVISPINAFLSWKDEITEIFKYIDMTAKVLSVEDIDNSRAANLNKVDVILVNYEKMRRNINSLLPFFLENNIHLVLDESHRIKSGYQNISYNQIIKLGDLAKRRDILSGTPMPHSLNDLYPQFDFLWPGEEIIPTTLPKAFSNEAQIVQVNRAIKDLYVRTTKNELGLLDPDIQYVNLAMGPIQHELYRLFKSEAARVLAGLDKNAKSDFRRIGRSVVKLLQAATNPMLLSLDQEYYEDIESVPDEREFWELLREFSKYEKPVKIEYLKKRIKKLTEENPDTKILVWTYFVQNIKILERIFQEYNPVSIFGGIPTGSDEEENTREWLIRKFHNDPTCRLMIGNPQACGEGISLHKACHHAIYLDRNFNAAFFLQSVDRIHRLGLAATQTTKVEILVTENTIDEILIYRLNNKITTMGQVLEDDYLQSLAYDPADILPEDEVGVDQNDLIEIQKHIST